MLLHHPPTLALDKITRVVPVLLLLPPLPLQHDPNKVLEIEIGPQTINEEYLRVLMTLPEHKVAEPLYATGSHKEFQRRVSRRVHVVVEDLGSDGLWVRELAGRGGANAEAGFRRVRRQGGGR